MNMKRSYVLATLLVLGGFFVFNSTALAVHTTSVEVNQEYVAGGSTDTYTFTVTNDGPDAINYIKVTAPVGFTIIGNITCPTDTSETYDWTSNFTDNYVICQTSGHPANSNLIATLDFGIVGFTATADSPEGDDIYDWSVYTEDTVYDSNINIDASTTVDVTAPVTSIIDAPEEWQTSPIEMSFTCADDSSGCGLTYYSLDGSDPSVPYDETPVSIFAEGSTTVKYKSVDNVGNEEVVNETTVQIDTDAPVTSDNVDGLWHNDDVTVTLSFVEVI